MQYVEEHIFDEFNETEENSQNDLCIEDINCYNPEEEHLVKQALREMGFSFLAETFKNEEIDYEAFKNMNSGHIGSILKDYKIGLAVKFEIRFGEWKSKVRMIDNKKIPIRQGIVVDILQSTYEGQNFLKNAGDTKFDRTKEKSIASFICSYFFARKQLLPVNDLILIGEDIQRSFPKELSTIYVQILGKSSTGVLYDKYNNMLRSLRRNDLMPSSASGKRKAKSSQDSAKKIQRFNPDETSSNEFVKLTTADIDHDLLAFHWRRSSHIRADYLRQKTDVKISSVYRALLRPDGYQLISIDFDNLFPNRNFKKSWMETEVKLKHYLMENVHQSLLSSQLKNLDNMTSNRSLATILLGIHNILFGDKVAVGSSKNRFYKPTVFDAFNFLLLILNDESTMEVQLNDWKKDIEGKELNYQCLIIGFGDSNVNLKDKFCVLVEDIRYVFEGENALLSALEVVLHIYHVLDLSYPLLNASVYSFLSSKFLSIEVGKKANTSKIIRLISALD